MAIPLRSKLFTGPFAVPTMWTVDMHVDFEEPKHMDEYGDCYGFANILNADCRSMWAIPPDVYKGTGARCKHIGFSFYAEIDPAKVKDPEIALQKLFGHVFKCWKVRYMTCMLAQETREDLAPKDSFCVHQVYYLFNAICRNPIQRYALSAKTVRWIMDAIDDMTEIGTFTRRLLELAAQDFDMVTKCSFPIVRKEQK